VKSDKPVATLTHVQFDLQRNKAIGGGSHSEGRKDFTALRLEVCAG